MNKTDKGRFSTSLAFSIIFWVLIIAAVIGILISVF